MNYKLNLGSWNKIFAVPTDVVDNYIKISSGDNLKVLLFLLRNAGSEMNGKIISSALGISEEETEDALAFWCQRGIIDTSEGTLTPAQREAAPKNEEKTVKSDSIRRIELTRAPEFAPKEIASTVRGSSEANYLFKRCEELLGRNLSHYEQNTLMIILTDVCMPVGVTLLLVEYCFSIGKATPAYMRSLAVDWMDRDIKTIEKAEQFITELRSLNDSENKFRKMFGVTSVFSKQQRDYITKWVNTFNFSDAMISAAYELTLDATGKLSFPYMNKILTGWHDKGIKSPEQISQKKATDDKKSESSFDVNEIEKMIARKYNKQEG